MKSSTKTFLITTIFSVTLLLIGFYSWNYLFMAILPIVGNVNYESTSLTEPFRESLFFALTLALIPISAIIIWKFAPVFSIRKKILTVGLIVIVMTSFVVIRREMIKYQARSLQPTTVLDYSDPSNPKPKTIETRIPLSSLNFELFALVGLATGSIISFFFIAGEN